MQIAGYFDSLRSVRSAIHIKGCETPKFDYLKEHNLKDSTIVLLTGDHGEEFMDNGRWGQIRLLRAADARPILQ